MENTEIGELVKRFDNFVHFSLTHKETTNVGPPQPGNKVQTYLTEMEKRLKLRPRSHNQRFEDLLKPMKDLKSFVSVKEFMQSLGSTMGKPLGKTTQKEEKSLKLQYQNLRGGYYLQKIQTHLKNKKFKRSANANHCFPTELDTNSLETSEYRSWIEGALNKISLKNDQFFKKESKIKVGEKEKDDERDCLIEEHQKEYADQFKVVPHIREMCSQEFENFSKITTLLTGRLRKILKNKGTLERKSVTIIKNRTTIDSDERKQKQYMTKPLKMKLQKENTSRAALKINKKRVQTAGTQRREECDIWRDSVNSKLKSIINQSTPNPIQL